MHAGADSDTSGTYVLRAGDLGPEDVLLQHDDDFLEAKHPLMEQHLPARGSQALPRPEA